jgi:hypothetical protein
MNQGHPVTTRRLVKTGGNRIFFCATQHKPGYDVNDIERPRRGFIRRVGREERLDVPPI